MAGKLGMAFRVPLEARMEAAAKGGRHKPSMLQDYERGRPMEIEAQVMAPLAFARAAGVPVPAFELAAALAAHKAAAQGLYDVSVGGHIGAG